jgi:chromosome segregation ATPase
LRNEYAQKEDFYRNQIERLEQKLQQSETKTEEMLLSAKDATAPLLLQIEKLESELRLAKTDKEGQEMLLLKRIQLAERENSDLLRKISEIEHREAGIREESASFEMKLKSINEAHSNQIRVSAY